MAVTENQNNWPGIPEFYSHKDVFITGATGFMGKCLLEKLLRSVPDIGQVMILIRPKWGKSVQERVGEILGSQCFDAVRESCPETLDKVVPISGDISEPNLGVGDEDAKLLSENVSVVFHLAATVKFDAPIRESLTMNVLGVKEMVKMAREMKKLVSFVHISTAFAHCNREGVIEETIYPPKIQPDRILALLDWMSDEQLDAIAPSLLEGRPNTYTYTKSLAEYYLAKEAKDLPVSIVRPSIVSGSRKEPFPGWVDSLHGPTGIVVAVGKGLIRVVRANPEGIADMVPVDMLNNTIISVGWMTGLRPTAEPIIYQYTSGTVNPITWIDMYPMVINCYTLNPFDEVFRRPYLMKCRPVNAWRLWHTVLHLIPGYLADLLLRLQGKKPMMVKIYHKIDTALMLVDYFMLHHWQWTYTNCDHLYSQLNEADKETFDFDIAKLNWNEYIKVFTMGTKTYLLKEDPANIPVARKRITRLRNMRYTFNLVMLLIATRVVYIKSSIARELWSSMLGFCIQMVLKFVGFIIQDV